MKQSTPEQVLLIISEFKDIGDLSFGKMGNSCIINKLY